MHKQSDLDKAILVFAIIGTLITQYLFFIDEGYNDFRWMKSFGNWIVYLLYFGAIFFTQFIGYLVVKFGYQSAKKLLKFQKGF